MKRYSTLLFSVEFSLAEEQGLKNRKLRKLLGKGRRRKKSEICKMIGVDHLDCSSALKFDIVESSISPSNAIVILAFYVRASYPL